VLWLALGAALVGLGLTLLILLALRVTEPGELSPLPVSGAQMRRFAEGGQFPLSTAANVARRVALSAAAALQTFGVFAIVFVAAALGAWRGFVSPRIRGWSNAFWASSVAALCLAPSVFDGLTPPMLDYAVMATASGTGAALLGPMREIYGPEGLNSQMLPAVFLIERAIAGAALAAFFAVLAHDLAYRLREALEDFEFIEVDEDRGRRASAGAGPGSAPRGGASNGRRPGGDHAERAAEGGFGHRHAPPPDGSSAPSEDSRARAVLGVGANASRREIERAHKSQIKRAHPDHGGSVARAAALNAARDVLLRRR
jgi:hypothetical protein